jgi:Tfp pilus assembly protein PilF
LSFDPGFLQARASLGAAYLMQGDATTCLEECMKVVRQEPHFGPAWNNIGLAHLELGEKDKARDAFDKALASGYDVPEQLLQEAKS